jgi:hypothetical protein
MPKHTINRLINCSMLQLPGPKLELTIEIDFGYDAHCWQSHIPSTLFKDEQDRLYLERWKLPHPANPDDKEIWIDNGEPKPLRDICEGDITPVSPRAALEWYVSVNQFADGSTGDFDNLFRIAAKALPED